MKNIHPHNDKSFGNIGFSRNIYQIQIFYNSKLNPMALFFKMLAIKERFNKLIIGTKKLSKKYLILKHKSGLILFLNVGILKKLKK